eukprot:CAMPEP_0115663542 /NCGR_PEP_ID=MMETSP0272-20121206/47893_1 /TAXON_ID=71861 /ORGANISM="Scrippsiella trochoidea, Strain CCMP3099" /LENGTH=186 /DNA_ID=CAMNT_0003101891 /DNA_START=149 /DNA_END=709 /DNA_ORIENTATION=+
MFLSKLKAFQDVMIALILGAIFAICNADSIFARFRFYKVFIALRKPLQKDCASTVGLSLLCLALHGQWHEARWPGAALHLSSLAAWALYGVQTGPMVSCGIWAGGKNQMTKIQLMLRIIAQATGSVLAFAIFGLYFSFRFPGEGPFSHFFGLESLGAAVVAFIASVAHIRHREQHLRSEAAAAKTQ